MTTSLILFRHGKSDRTIDYDTDMDRPLNRRGRDSAVLMGQFLADIDQVPDLALTSPARRAVDTLDLARRAGAWDCPVEVAGRLYGHGPAEAVQLFRTAIPSSADVVVAVGHEPTWSELVEILTGATVRFPTAAMVNIEIEAGGWGSLAAGTGRLRWLMPSRAMAKLAGRSWTDR